jgi:hypothetical protein
MRREQVAHPNVVLFDVRVGTLTLLRFTAQPAFTHRRVPRSFQFLQGTGQRLRYPRMNLRPPA